MPARVLATILHRAALNVALRRPSNGAWQMFTILFIVLILALIGGGMGHSRYGYAGWSPAGMLIVILLLLMFTGHRL